MSPVFGRLSIATLALVTPFAAGCGGGGGRPTSTATSNPDKTAIVPASYKAPSTSTPAESAGSVAGTAAVSYADGETAFRTGHYNDAETLFTTYTGRHPENAWGFYMLGLSAWKSGNLAHATEAFDRALTLDPQHRKSLLNSARVLLELNRAEDALGRVNQALAIEPMSGEALRLLGRAYHELGRADEAIDAYHRALILDSRDVWAMNNLGLLYIQLGRYQEAVPPLARATELRGTSPVFQNNLAIALERTGHYTASRTAYETALRADSTYDNAKQGLVRVTDRKDDQGIESVDVPALAQEFAAQVQDWQTTAELVEPKDSTTSVVPAAPMARDTADISR
jgi:predicted Zn-dependent protease